MLNTIFTGVLAVAAIIAGILAFRNIGILRKQHRMDTFLSLMNELSSSKERRNRGIIFRYIIMKGKDAKYPEGLSLDTIALMEGPIEDASGFEITTAIEETVSCLDRTGYFVLKGDPKLKDEAPISIWVISNQMWERLSAYVQVRREHQIDYGRYFEELAKEAYKYTSNLTE